MGIGRPLSERTRRRVIGELHSNPASLTYLAFRDHQPVGLTVCFVGFSTFAGRPLVNVHDLVVHADHRRTGIARELLKYIEADSREMDCCKLTLEVRDDNNPAKSLYRAYGFAAGQPTYEFWTKPI
jgi:ribosomal protein S18 acetylase RimI-like enzyme